MIKLIENFEKEISSRFGLADYIEFKTRLKPDSRVLIGLNERTSHDTQKMAGA